MLTTTMIDLLVYLFNMSYHLLVHQLRDCSQTKPANINIQIKKRVSKGDREDRQKDEAYLRIHTSCNSKRESNVFLEEVIRSVYAVETFSSSEQKHDLTASCKSFSSVISVMTQTTMKRETKEEKRNNLPVAICLNY